MEKAAEGAASMRKARLTSLCQECQEELHPGDDIYPLLGRPGLKRSALCWVHLACAERLGLPPVPPCKHFLRSGYCQYGSSCFFAHPEEAGKMALERMELRRSKPNAKVANRGEGRRNAVKNYSKSSVLRRWLLDHVGIEKLRSGCVLDVAGGKGELAWELLNLNLVEAVVLDPRPLDLKTVERKWRHGLFWRNPIFHHFLHCDFDGTREPKVPQHLRLLLTDALMTSLTQTDDITAVVCESRRRAMELRWTRKGLVDHEDETVENEELEMLASEKDSSGEKAHASKEFERSLDVEDTMNSKDDFDNVDDMDMAKAFLETIKGCSMVVALHPDQATEVAIRLALHLQKPFAVVPCCVYASDFPKRKLKHTQQPVRTYQELLEYLQDLDPRIERSELDFEGKSTLLFMKPSELEGKAMGWMACSVDSFTICVYSMVGLYDGFEFVQCLYDARSSVTPFKWFLWFCLWLDW